MHHAGPFATDDEYRKYENIGRKIANRLRRSPIAAVTVGKQLQNESTRSWETTANLDVLKKTMGALWWSYKQLGVDIRRCFAYCSTFPKGYRFKRDELVRIWIAQGFVNTGCNRTEDLEDIGQHYFDQLLKFSFLQVQISKFVIKTEAFTIHDLLHKLAVRVSGSEFFRIRLNDSPKDMPRGVLHLFIETNNVAKVIEKILDIGNLRTLIIKEAYAEPVETMKRNHDLEKILDRLFMRLRKLRLLIIKRLFSSRKVFPKSATVPITSNLAIRA
ncbi:disease resistance protein RPM1-like [Miscanthus floridulus]|uniref:disease resistance protein RPM1-like n=1 Tax=Miscanthus floridulus TaxID=154761 RepID=UPI00345AF217